MWLHGARSGCRVPLRAVQSLRETRHRDARSDTTQNVATEAAQVLQACGTWHGDAEARSSWNLAGAGSWRQIARDGCRVPPGAIQSFRETRHGDARNDTAQRAATEAAGVLQACGNWHGYAEARSR